MRPACTTQGGVLGAIDRERQDVKIENATSDVAVDWLQ